MKADAKVSLLLLIFVLLADLTGKVNHELPNTASFASLNAHQVDMKLDVTLYLEVLKNQLTVKIYRGD